MFYISMIFYRFKLEDLSHSVNGSRMAGRVFNRIMNPNRPSTKNDSLILHFDVDVKRLVEEGKDFPWPRPHRCPCCQGRRLWGHGYAYRYFEGFSHGLWMKRYRCPDCGAVHTLRPRQFYKGFHYSRLSILLSLLSRIIHGRWLKCLPRQVQQYWFKGLRFQASRGRNRKHLDVDVLSRLFGQNIILVTHSFQSEILRL